VTSDPSVGQGAVGRSGTEPTVRSSRICPSQLLPSKDCRMSLDEPAVSHALTSVPRPPSCISRWQRCTEPRPSTTIWRRPGGAAGTSVSARAQHVSQPMAASTLLM
jgi:hypothetical protein